MATVNENDLCLWWAGKVSTYGNTTLVQTHTVLVNSKVFLTYVGWKCLFMYLVSLNAGLANLLKATWPLFLESVYLTNIVMSL